MATLRGGTWDKQIHNALMRMEKFGISRHNTESKGIHSKAVFEKRKMYLNDFKQFAEKNHLSGKLNTLMTNENITQFFNTRLEHLSKVSSENLIRGFSAMVDDLRNHNIAIPVDKDIFDKKVLAIKSSQDNEIRLNRAVSNPNQVISNLYDKHFHSGVMAEVSQGLGFRLAESAELTTNLDKYLDRDTNTISGIRGKGGQEYQPKQISPSLVAKVDMIENHISKSTYMNDLKEEGISSHDFRYSFASNTYQEQIDQGKSHQEALLYTSKELNHHRSEITNYYLKRA